MLGVLGLLAMATASGETQSPAAAARLEAEKSPYAVCAHITRGEEHPTAQRELAMMATAGIEWGRADVDRWGVEPQRGEWNFDSLDETVHWAEVAGVQLLPVLGGNATWTISEDKKIEEWLNYVRRVVSRYKDRLRYWEVVNEPNNLGMDAVQYSSLLKATYTEIKKIDSGLTVVLGGVGGIPENFLRGIYQSGAGSSFDVMNVHPYRGKTRPERGSLYEDLEKLRGLMRENEDGTKPIWITELGWPTHCAPETLSAFLKGILDGGLAVIDSKRKDWSPVMLDDPLYPDRNRDEAADTVRLMLAPTTARTVALGDLAALSPANNGLLIMPPGESFRADRLNDIERYVRDGGVVMFWGGVPLYNSATLDPTGDWHMTVANDSYRRRLHLAFEAWWTKEGVPHQAAILQPAESWPGNADFPSKTPAATRFLTNAATHDGDRFEPVALGVSGDYRGVAAGAYKFDSDLKGGLIVAPFMRLAGGVTPERQGQLLPRAYLISLQAGVERMFWYEFLGMEIDPYNREYHFGLTHSDLSPKPAYQAIMTLRKARPPGSEVVPGEWRSAPQGVYYPHWKRPDGQLAWALWVPEGARRYQIEVSGEVNNTFDHLGQQRDLKLANQKADAMLSESILYIVGPQRINVTPISDAIMAPDHLRLAPL